MVKFSSVLLTLFFSVSAGALNNVDQAFLPQVNLLKNPGFENGKADWTASGGTFSIASHASTVRGLGKNYATWDSDAADQTLCSGLISVEGNETRNTLGSMLVKVPSGTATHIIGVYDESDNLLSSSDNTVFSSTYFQGSSATAVSPASGSIKICIKSVAADEPSISLDTAFTGENYLVGSVGHQTAWKAYTPIYTGFGTVGTSNMRYRIVGDSIELNGHFVVGTPTATEARVSLPLDYTSSSVIATLETNGIFLRSTAATASTGGPMLIEPSVGYVTFGDQETFSAATASVVKQQGSAIVGAGETIYIQNMTIPISELAGNVTAYAVDQTAQSWSGYHDTTCLWSTTSTTFATPTGDASCALTERTNTNFGTVTSVSDGTGPQPAITFTPKMAGKYKVCATVTAINATSGAFNFGRLTDGTNELDTDVFVTVNASGAGTHKLCGIYTASSTSSHSAYVQIAVSSSTQTIRDLASGPDVNPVQWTIEAIQSTKPASLIKKSILTGSDGVTKICRISCTQGGTQACTSSQDDCVASVTDNGAGLSSVAFTVSYYSAAPFCMVNGYSISSTQDSNCERYSDATTSGIDVKCNDDTAAGADRQFDLICWGAP